MSIKIEWTLEKRKIHELKEYEKNPRTLTKDQESHLKASIEKFGLIDKPIINTDNCIIGGHQRLRVLTKLKIKEIECYVPNQFLDEKQVEELNIRLNKNHGNFDFDVLANLFDPVELVQWGFNAEDLIGSIDDIDSEDEEENSKKKKKTKSCPSCGHEF